MPLNLSALKDVQEDLNKRTSGGNYLYQKNIGEETDIRILPPVPALNEVYFKEQIVWWINAKNYVSPLTFGEDCPIQKEIEEAEIASKTDRDLAKLLDSQNLRKQSQFLIPILLLDVSGGEEHVKVVDDKAKILVCGVTLLKSINKIVTNRQYQNGTPDGIMDRVKGFNLILSKVKTGQKAMDVDYTAQGYRMPSELPEKYYKNIPDVDALTRKNAFDDKYLTGVIRNYLYGEPLPKEEGHARFTGREQPPVKEKQQAAAAPSARGGGKAAPAPEKPKPSGRGAKSNGESPAPPKKNGRRSAAEDLDKDDEEYDNELPFDDDIE